MTKNEKLINDMIHGKDVLFTVNDKIFMYRNKYYKKPKYIVYMNKIHTNLVVTECTIELKECLDMIDFLGECYD